MDEIVKIKKQIQNKHLSRAVIGNIQASANKIKTKKQSTCRASRRKNLLQLSIDVYFGFVS
jgi:hypothetical protein